MSSVLTSARVSLIPSIPTPLALTLAGNGYRYAGLKYYGVCYCGSALNGPQLDDSECSFPCSGNPDEVCGGNNQLSVWEDPTIPNEPVNVSVDDYESLGCYTDDAEEGRALSFDITVPADTFTPSTCLDACRLQGFPYAGTEYGRECWCGTNLGTYSKKVDSEECSIACAGDDSKTCGGRSRLELFYAKKLESTELCGIQPPTVPEPSTTSAQSTTVPSSTAVSSTSVSSTCTETTSTQETTSTSEAPITTEKPATTTEEVPSTTSLCTATQTTTPDCEFKYGKWCAPAIPDWEDKNGCHTAAKACALQVSSCFKSAGWPGAMDCFKFSEWCGKVKEYCSSGCRTGKCGKKDCWNKHKPEGGKEPTTTTSVYPCPTSTLSTTVVQPTSTSCPPQPTNICKQPSSDYWGYGPGKPVAGIELPVVGCNDIEKDWKQKPFKLYTSPNSRNCLAFKWHQRPDVCADACEEQYEDCRETYVQGCRNQSWRGWHHKRSDEADEAADVERRTWGWSWGSWSHNSHGGSNKDDTCASSDSRWEWSKKDCDVVDCWGKGGNDAKNAEKRCKAQYKDCLAVNKKVNPGSMCQQWCPAE